jgi:hypothetical protein
MESIDTLRYKHRSRIVNFTFLHFIRRRPNKNEEKFWIDFLSKGHSFQEFSRKLKELSRLNGEDALDNNRTVENEKCIEKFNTKDSKSKKNEDKKNSIGKSDFLNAFSKSFLGDLKNVKVPIDQKELNNSSTCCLSLVYESKEIKNNNIILENQISETGMLFLTQLEYSKETPGASGN